MTIPYIEHLRADGARMAAAVARDLDAHVPSCPKWNVAKLAIHTGQHHRWVADAVKRGGEAPDAPPKPGLRGEALVDWFREGWSDLADLLDRTPDDDTPAWSWSGDNRVGFWRRRTALETLVHRWDAENATGTGGALDAELSADGIDELFFVMLPSGGADPFSGESGGRIAYESSDAEGGWVLQLEPGASPTVERAPRTAEADARVTAPAGDLLLYLWGRMEAEVVKVEGDAELFRAAQKWMR